MFRDYEDIMSYSLVVCDHIILLSASMYTSQVTQMVKQIYENAFISLQLPYNWNKPLKALLNKSDHNQHFFYLYHSTSAPTIQEMFGLFWSLTITRLISNHFYNNRTTYSFLTETNCVPFVA